jgi:hypothetical protein
VLFLTGSVGASFALRQEVGELRQNRGNCAVIMAQPLSLFSRAALQQQDERKRAASRRALPS